MVNRVVSKGELTNAAEAVAEKIAARDPAVVRGAKRAVVQGQDLPLVHALDLEKKLAVQLAGFSRRR